ncbi:MAG: hypothetical protein JXB30_18205 [Anaerolineae bacterium]|nr:hypothetical protein [Anaerolineae bacterium]
MRYKIIKGTFHIAGYTLSENTIKFKPVDANHWDFFDWKKRSPGQRKRLRFEAIDMLEMHYKGLSQPRSFGIPALETLFELLGIHDVVLSLSLAKVHSAKDGVKGFIASPALDMCDRPISLVFADDVQLNDGDEVTLADLPLDQCVNVKLAKKGLVYPTFYTTMEDDLLNYFAEIAAAGRKGMVGLWELDKTNDFTLSGTSTITDDIVILPKLFRRLVAFFHARSDFAHLASYLAQEEDRVLIRSTDQMAYLSDLLVVDNRNVRLPYALDDLVFEPRG